MSVFTSYDGVIIGLNHWPKLMAISIIVMVVVGFFQFTLNKQGRIRRRYNQRFIGIISAIFASAVAVAIFVECSNGIVKYCDNNCLTAYDSSAWSVIMMFVAIEFFGMMWFALDYAIGIGVGRIRHNMISKRHHIHHTTAHYVH